MPVGKRWDRKLRERRVYTQHVAGFTDEEVARNMHMNPKTVHRLLSRERYQALIAKVDALTPKIEELGGELVELLEKPGALYHDAAQELRYYDGDGANALSTGVRPAVQDFIDRVFYRWLH